MKIKVSLGLKIRELRKKQGISQEKFSELIDMNPRQIVRIESGESFPTAENLEKIAEALNIKPQELFFTEEFESEKFLREEIKKSVDKLNNKDLKTIYLIIKNL
ncbi:helix-turn-helix transcriptional regulator [bacterium]|nr:helix-turn-helix transcriptional regulator [bacterium]